MKHSKYFTNRGGSEEWKYFVEEMIERGFPIRNWKIFRSRCFYLIANTSIPSPKPLFCFFAKFYLPNINIVRQIVQFANNVNIKFNIIVKYEIRSKSLRQLV